MLRVLAGIVACAATALSASLQEVTDFGPNPTGLQLFTYIPDKLAEHPPIVVALHACLDNVPRWFNSTDLSSHADRLGFPLIYPQTTNQRRCWTVNDAKMLTRGGGGDSDGIISMVDYALSTYGGDPANVFVLGSSSGAMMTNVLAGTYPDRIRAGAGFSGIRLGCAFGQDEATPLSRNQTCAQGEIVKTAREWGDVARTAFPGYAGARPRLQFWHGLDDALVRPALLGMELAQWSDVLGLGFTGNTTGVPSAEWTQIVYGDGTQLVGYEGVGVGHPVPIQAVPMLDFFGINSCGSATA